MRAPWPVIRSAIWMLLAAVIVPAQADPDLWGHVRFGLDLLQTHHLPSVDVYSFTQDVPWINHEWLSELVMGALYRGGGPAGLSLLKILLAGSTLAVVARGFRNMAPLLMEAFTALVLWGALPLILTIRPQLWTFLAMAVLCGILIQPARRRLQWLPLLFALWANLHGGWIVGLAVLCLWAGGELWRRSSRDVEPATILTFVLLAFLATLVNPYGIGLWTFMARTVRLTRTDITEWQPLWTTPWVNWLPWVIAAVIAAYTSWRRNVPLSRILSIVGLGFASLRVARLAPLFVEAAVIFFAPVRLPAPARFERSPAPKRSRVVDLVNIGALAGVMVAVVLTMRPYAGCIRARDWRPDGAALISLRASRPSGTLAVWFDWGEYALWHLSPGLRVSVDGRRETLYSDRTLREQGALSRGEAAGLDFIRRVRPGYIWFPASNTQLKSSLPGLGYRLDIDDARSFVGVRNDLPTVTPQDDSAVTDCFPGP